MDYTATKRGWKRSDCRRTLNDKCSRRFGADAGGGQERAARFPAVARGGAVGRAEGGRAAGS